MKLHSFRPSRVAKMHSGISHGELKLDELHRDFVNRQKGAGAVVTFTGYVRDFNDSGQLDGLELEHYPGMTEKALESLVEDTMRRFECLDMEIVHRVGRIDNFNPIVWVATAALHRKSAFEAAMYTMDTLKQSVPLWKKEWQNGNATWVQAKASDNISAMRWLSK